MTEPMLFDAEEALYDESAAKAEKTVVDVAIQAAVELFSPSS